MAMIKEFECINDTEFPIILMESVEGVNRPLARISAGESYVARSIVGSTTDCEYIMIVQDQDFSPDARANWRGPSHKGDFWDWDFIANHVLYAPECSQLSVLQARDSCTFYVEDQVRYSEHNTGDRSWNIVSTMLGCFLRSDYSQMGIRDELHPALISGFHCREISSLLRIEDRMGGRRGSAALELWESKEKVFRLEIENSEAELKDHGNIIFQLVIGFYTVFHGVLFTVVAQADSPFTCGKIYISYIVSIIISLVTIFGVIKNVSAMELLKKLIYEHKARLLAVCRWQSTLKREGGDFDYGRATLRYKPMGDRRWWPLPWLPLKAAIYAIFLLVCTVTLCFLMRQLQCK